MSDIRSFRDLDVWQRGMDTVELAYRLSAEFPDSEKYGLQAQMRRAAVSIPSTIAEGQSTRTPRWSLRYVSIAIGSAAELDTQLDIAIRLRFTTETAAGHLRDALGHTRRLLYGVRRERERRIALTIGGLAAMFVALLPSLLT